MREKIDTSILLILHGPPALLTFFSLPGPLSSVFYPVLAPVWSFFITILCSDFRFLKFAGFLRLLSTFEIASDAHSESHRQILALGLTQRIILKNAIKDLF